MAAARRQECVGLVACFRPILACSKIAGRRASSATRSNCRSSSSCAPGSMLYATRGSACCMLQVRCILWFSMPLTSDQNPAQTAMYYVVRCMLTCRHLDSQRLQLALEFTANSLALSLPCRSRTSGGTSSMFRSTAEPTAEPRTGCSLCAQLCEMRSPPPRQRWPWLSHGGAHAWHEPVAVAEHEARSARLERIYSTTALRHRAEGSTCSPD